MIAVGVRRRGVLDGAIVTGVTGMAKAQKSETLPFRIVATGHKASERPKPHADGSVLVVEMARGTLSRLKTNGTIEVVARLKGSPNGVAIGSDGAA